MMQMNDQKLIDITFEIALVAANYLHGKTNEEIAEWVAKQLRDCGFDTEPRGASWGILK